MSARRQLVLLVAFAVCMTLIVKIAQLALVPDFFLALEGLGRRVIENLVVQSLLVTLGFVWLISLCACAWERMEREYVRRTGEDEARREANRLEQEGHVRSLRVRREIEEATKERNDRGQSAA